jgi:hypothetical protein
MKIRLGWAIFDTTMMSPVRTGTGDRRMPKIYTSKNRASRYCSRDSHTVVPVDIEVGVNCEQTIHAN